MSALQRLLLTDGKTWAGIFSLVSLLMAIVAFATKGAFKIPAEWVTIYLGILGVYGITTTGGALAKHYVNSRFNSPPGIPPAPLEEPPEEKA